jgi:hypothetical protein
MTEYSAYQVDIFSPLQSTQRKDTAIAPCIAKASVLVVVAIWGLSLMSIA